MLPGIVGVIQANEALKILVGYGEPLVGRLLMFDAQPTTFRELKLRRDPKCATCGPEAPAWRAWMGEAPEASAGALPVAEGSAAGSSNGAAAEAGAASNGSANGAGAGSSGEGAGSNGEGAAVSIKSRPRT